MKGRALLIFLLIVSPLSGCGGSDGTEGVLIEGSLIQGSGPSPHSLRHGANQPLEHILMCALGGCARTDLEGRFGFIVSELPENGTFVISAEGHGLDTATEVEAAPGARDITVALLRTGPNEIAVASVISDGAESSVHEHERDEHGH